MKKVLITVSLLFASFIASYAQEPTNLWHDPSFEATYTDHNGSILSEFWKLGSNLIGSFNTVTGTEAKTGQRAIKIYPSENGNLGVFNEDYDWDRSYPCKNGDSFRFSYWYKGDMKITAWPVKVRVYEEGGKNNPFYEKEIEGSAITGVSEWTEKVVEFTLSDLPAGKTAHHFDIVLISPRATTAQGSIILDDFSLISVAGGSAPTQPAVKTPTLTREDTFQREISLVWEEVSSEEGITYEIMCNNNTYTTEAKEFIITGLEPDTVYEVKIRAKKGEESSEWLTKSLRTSILLSGKDDENRLPLLRTVAPNGAVHNKALKVFFSELHNANTAKITYKLDGTAISVENNEIRFSTTGAHVLEIRIEEDSEHVWILQYQLNVVD